MALFLPGQPIYYSLFTTIPSIGTVPLGTLPPASALSGIALFGQPSASASQAVNAMQSFATLPARLSQHGCKPNCQHNQAKQCHGAIICSTTDHSQAGGQDHLRTVCGHEGAVGRQYVLMPPVGVISNFPACLLGRDEAPTEGNRITTHMGVMLFGLCSRQDH